MRLLKLAAFVSLWGVYFVLVAMVHLWISGFALPNRRQVISRLNRNFTLLVRLILNIKVSVSGDEGRLERGGYMIIANHVSYVDGIVLGSIFPILFVSKREVKKWPIIGQWNVLCGTVFVNRQRKQLAGALIEELTCKLKQEANILLFPEGTSTNGERMLPFQTVPLAAPLRSRSTIVPVTIAYKTIDEQPVTAANRDLIYWYGDIGFRVALLASSGAAQSRSAGDHPAEDRVFPLPGQFLRAKKIGRGLLQQRPRPIYGRRIIRRRR
jgi:lyso-ornithine lipid O-acyltransferase